MKFIDPALENYCINKSHAPSKLCDELEEHTKAQVPMSQMLVGRLEASFLGFLIRSHQVNYVLEIGTFTGYSALAMAENLPERGKLTTIDVNSETTALAQSYFDRSPHGQKIKTIVGAALTEIPKLPSEFDLVFIDADKTNYLNYLKLALEKLSKTGLIVLDNCLWSASVLKDSSELDESALGIKAVNDYIASRKDLYGVLLPVRDGMFLVQKVSA